MYRHGLSKGWGREGMGGGGEGRGGRRHLWRNPNRELKKPFVSNRYVAQTALKTMGLALQ